MNNCDDYAIKALRFLDNDLEGAELEDFLSHLDSCASCRANVQAERDLTATLHRSRPLYSVPAALRERVTATAAKHEASGSAQHPIYGHAPLILRERISGALQSFVSWRVLAPAAVVVALCLAVVPNIERRVQAASYIDTAVASHRSYVNGDLQPGLKASSPAQVTAWFAGKVPFDFRLPASESEPGENPVYRLAGASLVNYKGSPAALVTYERPNDKISLLVDSSKSAVVAGGDEIRFGKLSFHYYNDSGFRVITWTNHGLSYALVSSVSGPARTSCLVCHQNMADHGDFKVQK